MHAAAGGFYGSNTLDHLHAGYHFTEHAVAPALDVLATVVEEIIVCHVDKELCGGRVGILGTGHRQGAGQVFQPVIGFVFDRLQGWLLIEILIEATTLNHETGNDAMEQCAVVVAGAYVLFEIGSTLGGLLMVQSDADIAVIGFKDDHRGYLSWLSVHV